MRDIMSGYEEVMEQHKQRGNHNMQVIVQDEMSKMDETFERLSKTDPVLKAVWKYMESEGLATLMQGGKVNTEILAEKLDFPLAFIRKAMQTYSTYLQQVFKNAESRCPGKAPWQAFQNQHRRA